ncbi:MAG: dTDP-4-dehydrorhamnose reductase [Chloroflexi bacterium]|nr:dTDP-4-dehydrorhamnose reductase [Chloroflexota bacterium]MCL5107744.1 dTDP-4-dehydrorhamnose reductase [Chloroflexota bacterium]
MKVLLAGCAGQLGRTIQESWNEHELIVPSESEFDITDWPTAKRVVEDVRPEVVVNAAAYTDVDACEARPELAYKVNALGPRHLASACLLTGAALVHISSNCVFDGSASRPYLEFDPANPISVYGASKQAGDQVVRDVLPRHYIVRTAWMYSALGRNFVKTILRLGAERPGLSMVADEVSSPTFAPDLASALQALVQEPLYGTYHLTNYGECSRLEFAREILRLAGKPHFPLEPISLRDYQRPSRPPLYSPLANTCAAAIGVTVRPWQEALAELVPQLLG